MWQRHLASQTYENPFGDVASRIKERCGSKKKNRAALLERLGNLPLRKRMTLRRVAGALKVSTSTIRRLLAAGKVRRHTSKVHPQLDEKNKVDRVTFALSRVSSQETLLFNDMYDVVHVDEKWFNQETDTRTFYLLADEEPPSTERAKASALSAKPCCFVLLLDRGLHAKNFLN